MKKDIASTIYLIDPQGRSIELKALAYDSEDRFQELLAQHHNLMDGEQFQPDNPRRWLLIDREVAISDGESDRWSLDHLFVDQDAIPTLVEVKRKSDTRLRREVIAQMLDYAANASFSWSEAWMKERFSGRCVKDSKDSEAELAAFLEGVDLSPDTFWIQARKNLAAGQIRLVFVADRIPAELARIVEFLNEQMHTVEVLALELRHYSGGGFSTHIPRVFGATARVEAQRQGAGARRVWDAESFDRDLAARLAGDERTFKLIREFVVLARSRFEVGYGTGAARGSITFYERRLSNRGPLTIYSDGGLQIKSGWLDDSEPARAWRTLLQEELASKALPLDSGTESSFKLAPADWCDLASKYLAAVSQTRDRCVREHASLTA